MLGYEEHGVHVYSRTCTILHGRVDQYADLLLYLTSIGS
jgi:hypothetical protein